MVRISLRLAAVAATIAVHAAQSAIAQQYRAEILETVDRVDELWPIVVQAAQEGLVGHLTDGRTIGPTANHAFYWDIDTQQLIDLSFPGISRSFARAIRNDVQVGHGWGPATGGASHAFLWRGTAESAVDLHPTFASSSVAFNVSESEQVGYADINRAAHAVLWHGTAESAVDLHPAVYETSIAHGVGDGFQVGDGKLAGVNAPRHALLWNGTAESVVNLHPVGFYSSQAHAVSGDAQVGEGQMAFQDSHALLWYGNAASAVDLHPVGYNESVAIGVLGTTQVGYADGHAMIWHGTADSAVDLHQYLTGLPVNFDASQAQRVYENGQVYGFGLSALGGRYAIRWTPVPEPASPWALMSLLLALAIVRARAEHGRQ
jgi:hypothetical protein